MENKNIVTKFNMYKAILSGDTKFNMYKAILSYHGCLNISASQL
jgi:hypothetical protein